MTRLSDIRARLEAANGETCGLCGSSAFISGSDEGTNYYVPVVRPTDIRLLLDVAEAAHLYFAEGKPLRANLEAALAALDARNTP